MHPATPLIQAIWTCSELIGRGREKYQSPKYGPMTSQWIGVCVCDVGPCFCWVFCVHACVNACFSHIMFASSASCLCVCVCVHAHKCIRLSDMPVCVREGVCAFQGVEGSAQPPDGGYRSCLAPSLINFFPDWLWLLINKTWSGDQMQISLGWGGERGCWLLSEICVFLAPLPSTLESRAKKGHSLFFYCWKTC